MSDPTIISQSLESDGSSSFEQTIYNNGEDIWVPITGSLH